jgi:heme exporter protein B
MTRVAVARLVATKDLKVEFRSRVIANQVLPFAAIAMVMFAFALDNSHHAEVPRLVAPGLVWMTTLFSLLILVQRSFAIETADGAIDALRVAGVDAGGIFLGKAIALAIQLLALEVVLIGAALLLYHAEIRPSGVVLLVTTLLAATCGLAFVGTLYGGLAAGIKGRETLLPLLLLPVVAPVLIGATRALESAFGTQGVAISDGWPWLGLLITFAAAFGVVGVLAFGSLLDE